MQDFFVTGTSTGVGKTIASAIITEAMLADYWKPIQAGDLDNSDTLKVGNLVSNSKTKLHKSSYELQTPMSPHAAAEIDGIHINISNIKNPKTNNHLVIEGAGGLLVPLNDDDTILDIIKPSYKVIVVSKHYLGSINHTLLTVNWLKQKGYNVYILFNGDVQPSTENIILKKTGVPLVGRINNEKVFNKELVRKYAKEFKEILLSL